jgi:hypothetical protein
MKSYKDNSNRYIYESNTVGGNEMHDDNEFYIYDQNDFWEGTYSYENFLNAYKMNLFEIEEEEHQKTGLYNEIKKLYDDNNITSTYSFHNSITKSNDDNTRKKSFYRDIIKKYKIKLYQNCIVQRINIDKEDDNYVGNSVNCIINNKKTIIKANKEIIIATGTLSTCELLKNSGNIQLKNLKVIFNLKILNFKVIFKFLNLKVIFNLKFLNLKVIFNLKFLRCFK